MPNLRKTLLQLSGIIFIVIIWELLTAGLVIFNWTLVTPGIFKWILLPPPTDVLTSAISMILDGSLLLRAGWSLLRVLLGFLVAAVIAIPLGVAMGWSRSIMYIVNPVMEILRPIPPIAWIGLALLWFGIGLNSAVFLVFIGAFFPILLNTIDGVRNVEKRLIEVAYTFGANDREILMKVVVPAALPTIYTGMRVGMGIGWMCVVAAEMIAARYGLGELILDSSNLLQTDKVMVGMLTIGILGLAINYLFQIAGDRIFKWQEGINRTVA